MLSVFFFSSRRRHTRLQGDWSSDVCSSDLDAVRRLEQSGPNEIQLSHRISPWTILRDQFKNVLIVILLLATALSAFLGHGRSEERRVGKECRCRWSP